MSVRTFAPRGLSAVATRLRPFAIGLAAVLLASACAAGTTSPAAPSPAPSGPATAIEAHAVPLGATASVDDATWALAERIAAPSYTGDSTDAFKAALARAGIAVVADTSTDPATASPEVALTGVSSPVELLDFQAHALAVGAWSGTAFSGADLDSIAPVPSDSGSPSLSELLAGYAATADTPGGAFTRALLAGQDLTHPEAVRFPAAVLFLFVSDVATDGGRLAAPSTSPSSPAARLLPLAGGGPVIAQPAISIGLVCGGPSAWIDAIVDAIVHAVTVAVPQNAAGAIIVAIFGWIIHTVANAVKAVVNALLGPVLSFIRGIAVLASAIAEQMASVLPYGVHVTVSGAPAGEFSLVDQSQAGAYDVQVSAGDLPSWPDALKQCARAANIALPDFSTRGASVSFGQIAVTGTPAALLFPAAGAAQTALTDDTGQAHWPFSVAPDPGKGSGTYTVQQDTIQVTVHRKELDDLRADLTRVLLGQLPEILRPYLNLLLQPLLAKLQDGLNKLLDTAPAPGTATLYFHQPTPPTPSPSTTPSGSGACAVSQPAGTDQGSLTIKSTTIVPPGDIDLGEHGGENDAGQAPLGAAVGSDGSLSGQFTFTTQNHFEAHGLSEGTTDTTVVETGTVGGTVCSLVLRFLHETITACQATGYGTCGGVGQTVDLSGLVPPEPMGAPTVSGKTLTWSFSNEATADAGFGGLTSEVQSTITVTLTAP